MAGNLKLAMTQPDTPRRGVRYCVIWGALIGMVLGYAVMALLTGPMSWFMFGFTMVSLGIYAVCFKWSLEGVAYAARVETRRKFDQIVANG